VESQILNAQGQPYRAAEEPVVRGVYNLDSGFFGKLSPQAIISFERAMTQPYTYNPWVYACARTISFNLCRLPQEMVSVVNEEQSLKDHLILKLLAKPNQQMSGMVFRQTVVLNLLLSGECFLVPWDTKKDSQVDLSRGQMPDELMPFGRKFFEEWTEDAGKGRKRLIGWKFSIEKSPATEIPFRYNEIIRIHLVNPYDFLKSQAPYIAASVAVAQDTKADIYNTRLFDNDARVAGLLSTEGTLTAQQAEENAKRWMQKHGGPGNVGGIAVLGNGLKYQQFGLTLADMQFLEQKKWNKDQTLAAFGLNKIAVGDYEQINNATIREGRRILWYDTYIPLDEIYNDAITCQWVVYQDNGNWKLKSNYSDVESLRVDLPMYATGAKVLVDIGLPPALACKKMGISLTQEELKQYPYLSERLQPIAPIMPAVPGNEPPAASPTKAPSAKVTREISIEELRRKSDEYIVRALVPAEKAMVVDLKRYFFAQRNYMQDQIDRWLASQKSVRATADYSIDEFDDIYPNAEKELNRFLERVYTPNVGKQIKLEVDHIESELGEPIEWNVSDKRIDAFADKRKEDLASINETTFEQVKGKVSDTVSQAMKNNWTPNELAKALKTDIFDVAQNRVSNAQTIARTEMGIVASETRFDVYKQEGIEKWVWATAQDDRVRELHAVLEGDIANVGEAFPKSGGQLRYPRDTQASLDNIINCRCVALGYFED
jgi:HK97 family phage portal protein